MTHIMSSYLIFIIPIIGFIFIINILFYWFIRKVPPTIFNLKLILYSFIGIMILQALVLSFLNYSRWKNDPISHLLLPPYTSFNYFFHYSWQHYFFAPIVTIIFSLVVFWGIKVLNKTFNNTFFYDEEPYLAALGILVTGWPNCLIYLSLVLFLGIVSHFFYTLNVTLRRKFKLGRMIQGRDNNENSIKGEVLGAPPLQMSTSLNFRLSLLYFWLPCALLVLLLGGIISKYVGITQLSI